MELKKVAKIEELIRERLKKYKEWKVVDIHTKLEIMSSSEDCSYWLSVGDFSDFISRLQKEFHVEIKEGDIHYENFGSVFKIAVYLTGKINDEIYKQVQQKTRGQTDHDH